MEEYLLKPVERVLSGKDGRVVLQERLIERSGSAVQVSLNIPGFPKSIRSGRVLVESAAEFYCKLTGSRGWNPVCSFLIDNGAGPVMLLEIPGACLRELKRIAMEVEDRRWGGILDIDIIGVEGALHRLEMGGRERKCLLCREASKVCAREQRHDPAALRSIAARLIDDALSDISKLLHQG
jgi:holo-ACP synthase CitX